MGETPSKRWSAISGNQSKESTRPAGQHQNTYLTRSVPVSERGESLPDAESRETGQRTYEEEGVEEEYLPIKPMPVEPGQEVTKLVTPQTGSEQPNDDQARCSHTRH